MYVSRRTRRNLNLFIAAQYAESCIPTHKAATETRCGNKADQNDNKRQVLFQQAQKENNEK
jgi:hypothetical protein